MLGAILGDIIGSPYEFDNNNIKTVNFPLFSGASRFTDDTVMTVAVARALMETRGQSDDAIRKALVRQMRKLGRAHPCAGYGGRFSRWLVSNDPQPYNSYGNGSGMRVSPAGWLGTTLDETLHLARLTAEVTHNHPEGIKGAQAVAGAIFLARTKADKRQIANWIQDTFRYDLSFTLDEIRPNYHMDETCQGSVPQAIRAFLEGDSYESVVRLAVSIGGDSDTIACIAGSIAEACYGIPEQIALDGLDILWRQSSDLYETVIKFWDFCAENIDGNRDVTPLCNAIATALRQDARVFLPVDPPSGFPLAKDAKKLKVGDIMTVKEDVRLKIRRIPDGDGAYLIPVFTDVEQLCHWGDSSAVEFPLRSLMESVLTWGSCAGIAIDPSGSRLNMSKDCIRRLLV